MPEVRMTRQEIIDKYQKLYKLHEAERFLERVDRIDFRACRVDGFNPGGSIPEELHKLIGQECLEVFRRHVGTFIEDLQIDLKLVEGD